MLLPMPLRPLLLIIRSGFMVAFYPWVSLEHSYHHQDEVLPTMTTPVKGANNVATASRRLYWVVRMVVFARFRSAAPCENQDRTTVPDP